MKQKMITISLAAVMFLLALGLTLYPLISNNYNEKHQSEIHTAYQEQVAQAEAAEITEARELAIAYNESIVPGVQMADAFSNEALLWASEDYESQLNLTGNGIMGYVEIPGISVTLPIYHGTDADTLEIGIGHLLGSSLPVGGESTHTILTAHSGMASQKMFSDLPHETEQLQIVTGKDYCTLVTCTPFGVNTHRLLVRGTRIPYEEAEEILEQQPVIEEPTSTWEEKYMDGIITGICLVLILALLAGVVWFIRRK